MPVLSFIRTKLQQCSRTFPGAASSCLPDSRLRAFVRVAALVVIVGAVAVSCSDGNRRLGEREALDFRRNLVRKNYGDLSPDQRWRVMYHPARTKREIRSTLDDYMKDTARRRMAEAAGGSGQAGGSDVGSASEVRVDEGKNSGDESGQENPGGGEAEADSSGDDSSSDKEAGDS